MPASPTQLSVPDIKVNGSTLTDAEFDDLLTLSIESRLDLPGVALLEFVDPLFKYVDATKFNIGTALEIRMTKAETDTFQSLFKGEIIAIEPCLDSSTRPTVRIEATTKAHRLYSGAKSRTFLNVKDSDIFRKIAGEHGLSANIDDTPETYDHVSQAAQSDWEFIRERASRIGHLAFVDKDALCVKKADYSVGSALQLTWGEDLLLFRPRVTGAAQPSSIEVDAWDMQSQTPVTGTSDDATAIPSVGISGAQATNMFGRRASHLARWPAASPNDAKAIADGARLALWSAIIQAEGRCYGNPKLVAGCKVKVQNIGTRFSGEYIVSQARHFRDEDGAYLTDFEVRGLRSESFSDLVTGGVAADGWRPDSRWTGVVTGLVSNLNDPDGLGRVKLAFPWLDSGGTKFETNWARIAVPMAGNEKGVWFAPEVNDEVLVAFEHGDINRPYVVGFLYHGKAKPPATAVVNGKVEERMIFTRSGHKLTFIEKAGSEAIEIIDMKGANKITIDSTSGAITVEGTSITLKATQDVKIEGANVDIKANANFSVNASASIDLKANAQLNAQASGPASIKGAVINLN